jgi:hypothetical protein
MLLDCVCQEGPKSHAPTVARSHTHCRTLTVAHSLSHTHCRTLTSLSHTHFTVAHSLSPTLISLQLNFIILSCLS